MAAAVNPSNSSQAIVPGAKKIPPKTLDRVVNERVVRFLSKADMKALGCTNALYRNLIYAYRGMSYVNAQKIVVDNRAQFVGRGGETRAEAQVETNYMRCELTAIFEDDAQLTFPWLTDEILEESNKGYQATLIIAACAQNWKRGRCEEVSAVALVHIRKDISQQVTLNRYLIDRPSMREAGHVAMVVGDTTNGGQSAVVCDPWAQKVYVYQHRRLYVENYLGVDQNDKPILTRFNERLDTEQIEVICEPKSNQVEAPASPTALVQEEERSQTPVSGAPSPAPSNDNQYGFASSFGELSNSIISDDS
jgi:hypothetical protein